MHSGDDSQQRSMRNTSGGGKIARCLSGALEGSVAKGKGPGPTYDYDVPAEFWEPGVLGAKGERSPAAENGRPALLEAGGGRHGG